jgi:hypothetical protein
MNIQSQIELRAYGTSEGVQKAWDTRGRKAQEIVEQAGYKAVTHSTERARAGIRLSEPNYTTTYAHPSGARISIYKGPSSSNSWAHRDSDGTLSHGKTQEIGKLKSVVGLGKKMEADAAGGQTDSSSFVGRKYKTQDTKYGHFINEFNDPVEAEKSARARPYTRVISWPQPTKTQDVRDMARQRIVKTNPDVDS